MSFIALIQAEVNQKLSQKISSEKINLEGKSFARFGDKDHCWGIGHEWIFNHKKYWIYKFGSWRTAEKYAVESWTGQQTQGFWKKLASEIVEIETRVDTETVEKNKSCIDKWKPIFDSARPATENHPYLERKKVKPYTARVSSLDGSLLIPIEDVHGFVGVQIIRPDGSKIFSSGIKKRGSFVALSDFKEAPLVYVSEGFATAATIQEAFPGVPSIACLDCGNMTAAILSIREVNPKCRIIIAADDDESKAGEDAASKVVKNKKIPRVTYRLPKFPYKAKEMTDFNDLACAYGLALVVEQLSDTKLSQSEITPLGHSEAVYFYRSSENTEIVGLPAAQHDKKGFRRLIANTEFWSQKYSFVDENGVAKISWDKAADELMAACHAIGIFKADMVRGVGVWLDKNKIVINNGESNNAPLDTDYIYLSDRKKNLDLVEVTENPLLKLWEKGFSQIGTKNDASKCYLAAWFVQAFIFPLLDWRFNIWLRGPRGNGKTSILSSLADMLILSEFSVSATAAGVKSKFKNNQMAFCFDESEVAKSKEMSDFLDLARLSNSNKGGSIIRGTPSGTAVSSNPQIIFALGSIQDSVVNAADVSRWLFVDVERVEVDDWKAIKKVFDEYAGRKNEVFSFILKNYQTIKRSVAIAHDYLAAKKLEPRIVDQLSAVIGLYVIYFFDRDELTDVNLLNAVHFAFAEFQFSNSDYIKDNETNESDNAYDALMSLILDIKEMQTVQMIIYQRISASFKDCSLDLLKDDRLAAIGIRIFRGPSLVGKHELFISNTNNNRAKLLPQYPKLAQLFRSDSRLIKEKDQQQIMSGQSSVKGFRLSFVCEKSV